MQANPVHPSLVRTPLFAGVDFGILATEFGLGTALLFAGGFTWIALLSSVALILSIHLPVRYLTRQDPDILAVAMSAVRYRLYYPPSARLPAVRRREDPPLPSPHLERPRR